MERYCDHFTIYLGKPCVSDGMGVRQLTEIQQHSLSREVLVESGLGLGVDLRIENRLTAKR